jgi:hypothetical protein
MSAKKTVIFSGEYLIFFEKDTLISNKHIFFIFPFADFIFDNFKKGWN